ncbi:Cyclic nucleotide-gated ion channel 4 [Salvia divinorum]|uniref:Cyclic nucleotide-gated ion channel 4 n=1 Tax=Salvia divinorum TaxID=28513 RepID=A0ABD1HD98_SALDI
MIILELNRTVGLGPKLRRVQRRPAGSTEEEYKTKASAFGNLETLTDWSEMSFTIISNSVGVVIVTTLIGNIKNFLTEIMSKKQAMLLKMGNVEWWMGKRRLPQAMRQRVRNHER